MPKKQEGSVSQTVPDTKPPTGRIKSAPVSTSQTVTHQETFRQSRPYSEEENKLVRKESDSLYSDWSQEIEEEEERSLSLEPPPANQQKQDQFQTHRAGVLRIIPGDHNSNSSSPSSLSSHSLAAIDPRPRFFDPGNNQTPAGPQNQDQHRYLFDPNNPSKPILMDGEPSRRDRPGLAYQSPPGVSYRFPVSLPR